MNGEEHYLIIFLWKKGHIHDYRELNLIAIFNKALKVEDQRAAYNH